MLYYRVKKEYDQRPKRNGDIYIKNELYTTSEVKKNNLIIEYMEAVEVSKKNIYWFFGARFENKQ